MAGALRASLLVVSLLVSIGPEPASAAQEPPARKDAFGDPLPPQALARIGSIRLRHSHAVTGLVFSADGKFLASADQHGGVRLWDAKTAALVAQWTLNGKGPVVLCFSPEAHVLAANDEEGAITLLEVATGKVLRGLMAGGQPARAIAFSPDGKLLASAAWGQRAVLWDVKTGRVVRRLAEEVPSLLALGFSGDGTLVFGADFRGAIHHWRTRDGNWLGATPASPLKQAAFSPDGERLGCTTKAGEFVLRDTHSGKVVRRWAANLPLEGRLTFDGKTVTLGGSASGGTTWWDVTTGKKVLLPGSGERDYVTLAPDAKTAVTLADNLIRIWDLPAGKERFPYLTGPGGAATPLAQSPDGKTVAMAGLAGAGTGLWDTATGRHRATLGDRFAKTRLLAFQPGGRLVATAGGDNRVYLWDAVTGKRRTTLAEHGATLHLEFAPDGKSLVTVTSMDVTEWEPDSGKKLRGLEAVGKVRSFRMARYSPDGHSLAILQEKDFGNPENGERLCTEVVLRNRATGKARLLRKLKDEEISRIDWLAFSPDGKLVVLGSRDPDSDKEIEVVEVASGERVWDLPHSVREAGQKQFAWKPEAVFAAGGKTLLLTKPGIEFSNTFTGQFTVHLDKPFQANQGPLFWVELSTDGRTLATAGVDGTVLIWDASWLLKPREAETPLSAKEAMRCWEGLANPDGTRAWECVDQLCDGPASAVALLKDKLRPVPVVAEAVLVRLLAELDDPKFAVRNQAALSLEQLGEAAVSHLRKKLAKPTSLESRRRLEQLLEKIDPEQLRLGRALAVLEQINTPAARQLLRVLANGAPGARLTLDAQATLKRLAATAGS